MESGWLHLQKDEQTVQSFQSARGFEFLADDSVVQSLAESFDLFGAGPQGLLAFFGGFHSSNPCKLSFRGWIGRATWVPEGKCSPFGFTCRCARATNGASAG